MPLNYAKSKKGVQDNIETEIAAGKPPKQAVAIAKSVQRRGKPKKPGVLSLVDEIRSHLTESGKLRRRS